MFFMSINRIKPEADSAQIGRVIALHAQWTKEQIAAARIVQAGKWGDSGGMAIIAAGDLPEAQNILSGDPLVQSGMVTVEIARLYPDVEIKLVSA